ncbi:hypothetical protein FACS1894108_14340 [Planctomycetales bacterium]|nr:hypothetical protein FACS1894108_14340 [Planctomycetales bacterium]
MVNDLFADADLFAADLAAVEAEQQRLAAQSDSVKKITGHLRKIDVCRAAVEVEQQRLKSPLDCVKKAAGLLGEINAYQATVEIEQKQLKSQLAGVKKIVGYLSKIDACQRKKDRSNQSRQLASLLKKAVLIAPANNCIETATLAKWQARRDALVSRPKSKKNTGRSRKSKNASPILPDAPQNYQDFPRRLEQKCREKGIPIGMPEIQKELQLDCDSRHPVYKFDHGFFQVEIDETQNLARCSNYGDNKVFAMGADIDAVLERLQREHRRCFDRLFDGEKFLCQLRDGYLKIIEQKKNTDGRRDGDSVSLYEIMETLTGDQEAEAGSRFRKDEFIVDLTRLAATGAPHKIDGRTIDFQQTKDTERGFLLCGDAAARGYIGFVVFREDK